jgi:glycosyltransferase involved in cell wall biosynthesis
VADPRPAVLYLCYQSLLEPLTQTQVVAYLEGLARSGYRLVLLTFEPRPLTPGEAQDWRGRLAAKGIAWHWRRYHKRPTVPATSLDILVGILTGLWLIRHYRVRMVHARVHVPGVMALALRLLTRVKFLFDVRGLMAEEYADAGAWRANGTLFRATKKVERALVRAADGLVVLTYRGEKLLRNWYRRELRRKPLVVIPCCVDFRAFPVRRDRTGGPGPGRGAPTVAYVGKLGGWYLTREMTDFVAEAARVVPGLAWQVWTQSDPAPLRAAAREAGLGEEILNVGRLPPERVARELARTDAGLSFIKPCLSKVASSATKVGEYLAAGLPVVATAGIGDTDELLTEPVPGGKPVGVLVHRFTPDAYREAAVQLGRLLADPDTPARCREAAERHFHLERVGWARYRRLYRQLLGAGR